MVDPAVAALRYLQRTGQTGVPVNVEAVAEGHGIRILGCDHDDGLLEGSLVLAHRGGVITINSQIVNHERRRLIIANALGKHSDAIVVMKAGAFLTCTKEDIDNFALQISRPDKRRTTSFGINLLMNRAFTSHLTFNLNPSWDVVSEFRTQCKVPLNVGAIGFMALTNKVCAFVVSKDGVMQQVFPSKSFKHRHLFAMGGDRCLHHKTMAHIASNGKTPPGLLDGEVSNWCSGPYTPKDRIVEMTLPRNDCGEVFTILWDNAEIDMNGRRAWRQNEPLVSKLIHPNHGGKP